MLKRIKNKIDAAKYGRNIKTAFALMLKLEINPKIKFQGLKKSTWWKKLEVKEAAKRKIKVVTD